MIFKVASNPNHSMTLRWSNYPCPPTKTRCSHRWNGDFHNKRPRPSHFHSLSSGIWQEATCWSKPGGLIFVLVQANPTCTSPKNPILFIFFPQARPRLFQLFQRHFSRAPFRIWGMVKHFVFFTLNTPQDEGGSCSKATQCSCSITVPQMRNFMQIFKSGHTLNKDNN